MAEFKVTFFSHVATDDGRVGGFSDNFYISVADLSGVANYARQLAPARAALLPNGSKLIAYRATNVLDPSITDLDNTIWPGSSGLGTDLPQAALQVQLTAANGSKRQWLMRGVPDARIVGGVYSPTLAYNRAMDALFTLLQGWDMRCVSRANPRITVQGVTNVGAVTLAADIDVAVGDTVRFFRTRDEFGRAVKGPFLVTTRTDPRHFTVNNWTLGAVKRGLCQKYGVVYSRIASCKRTGAAVKKVGRAFFPFIGRRSRGR
jgi:hypothetical protein